MTTAIMASYMASSLSIFLNKHPEYGLAIFLGELIIIVWLVWLMRKP